MHRISGLRGNGEMSWSAPTWRVQVTRSGSCDWIIVTAGVDPQLSPPGKPTCSSWTQNVPWPDLDWVAFFRHLFMGREDSAEHQLSEAMMETQRGDHLAPREFPVQWGNRCGTNNCHRMPLVPFLEGEEGEEAGGGAQVRKVREASQRDCFGHSQRGELLVSRQSLGKGDFMLKH